MITFAAVFGGCIETDSDPASTSASSMTSGNETAAANAAPVAVIQVLANGTARVAENGTYAAAVGQNLTFDGSNSTDADGDNLTFTWGFGDNATNHNASAVFAFIEAGNKTVTLSVSDGNLTGTANVTIVVATSGPAAGTELRKDEQAFGNAPGGTYVAAGCFATLSKDWVLVDQEADGTASSVSTLTLTMAAMTSTGLNGYTKLSLKDPSGKVVKELTTGTAAKKIEVAGPLAAGTYKVEAAVCSTYLSTQVNSPAVAGVAVYVAV
jgi:hypothetical protein